MNWVVPDIEAVIVRSPAAAPRRATVVPIVIARNRHPRRGHTLDGGLDALKLFDAIALRNIADDREKTHRIR
jgi:hypothetical protein